MWTDEKGPVSISNKKEWKFYSMPAVSISNKEKWEFYGMPAEELMNSI